MTEANRRTVRSNPPSVFMATLPARESMLRAADPIDKRDRQCSRRDGSQPNPKREASSASYPVRLVGHRLVSVFESRFWAISSGVQRIRSQIDRYQPIAALAGLECWCSQAIGA